jgi:broad specificity phosphatase PhoE
MEPRAPLSGLGRLAADPARRGASGGNRRGSGAAAGGGGGNDCRQPARPRPPHRRADPGGADEHRADRLRRAASEISIGSWDGLDRDEIQELQPGIFDGDGRHEWYFRTPDGETYETFAGRIGGWLGEQAAAVRIVVAHGIVTRVLRGLYAGLPRAVALSLPVPQDRIYRLADGRIEEIAIG